MVRQKCSGIRRSYLALRDLKRWWQLLMVHFGCGINSPEIQIILTEMLTEHVSWISYLNFQSNRPGLRPVFTPLI